MTLLMPPHEPAVHPVQASRPGGTIVVNDGKKAS